MLNLPLFLLKRAAWTLFSICSFVWLHPFGSVVVFYLIFLCASALRFWAPFFSGLKTRLISLDNLPTVYVNALDESITQNKPFEHVNETHEALFTTEILIPRIIHRTYKTTNFPRQWLDAYESCRLQNPSYEHYFWTDETAREFLQTHYPWFLHTYDSYPYSIQRVDAVRYFLLWHYGGVYIDMDIGCRRPLDPLLDIAAAWMPETTPFGVSNDLMASTARHPFMFKAALSLEDQKGFFVSRYLTVLSTTGPMFLNNILARWISADIENNNILGNNKTSTTTTTPHGIAILPSMFYSQLPYTFFDHYPGSTWHGTDVALVFYLYRHIWVFIGIGGMLALAMAMVKLRVRMRRRRRGRINANGDWAVGKGDV